MQVLVVNTGSTSVKWTVFAPDETVLAGRNERWESQASVARAEQLRDALTSAPSFDAVGHRVVHGGTGFREAVIIDASIRKQLAGLAELDPEHMQASLAGIDAVSSAFPTLPQVAAFDTAFHATMSEASAGYGLPFEWAKRWGLRRFGFHGLSVAYALERADELLGATCSRVIVCHLGGGCSVTAVRDGRSIDTTMGFSPLDGLMMATRSGSVDPGVLLYLQQHCEVGIAELRETLTKRSGLLGVSGVSGDLREVLAAADLGSSRARLAYECFVISIRRALGTMIAVLGGVDTVVFTGGIGENSARVRRDATSSLRFAGLEIAEHANAPNTLDRDIAVPSSRVRVLVVHAREELPILKEVLRLGQAERASNDSVGTDGPVFGPHTPPDNVHVHEGPGLLGPLVRWDESDHRSGRKHIAPARDPAKKLIVFDLDGTLAESKASLDAEMVALLGALLRVVKVAVISGGGWPQFETQLLSRLTHHEALQDLSLLPTCGTKFYQYDSSWTLLYAEDFSDQEKPLIVHSLEEAIAASDYGITTTWGPQIEDRGSQITFSALGQRAPIEEKRRWDPDFAKRKKLQSRLEQLIPGFSVGLGGTTSVDVTKLGIDKGYGMRKLRDTLDIGLHEMLFIGDALFPGGNDYPAKQAGVESIQVRDPNESKRVIEAILACMGRVRRSNSAENATPSATSRVR